MGGGSQKNSVGKCTSCGVVCGGVWRWSTLPGDGLMTTSACLHAPARNATRSKKKKPKKEEKKGKTNLKNIMNCIIRHALDDSSSRNVAALL
jgi:hypothetical protein